MISQGRTHGPVPFLVIIKPLYKQWKRYVNARFLPCLRIIIKVRLRDNAKFFCRVWKSALKMDSFINNLTNLYLEEFIHLSCDVTETLVWLYRWTAIKILTHRNIFSMQTCSIVVSFPLAMTRVDCYQCEFRCWMLRCLLFLTFCRDGPRKPTDLNDEWSAPSLKSKTRNNNRR